METLQSLTRGLIFILKKGISHRYSVNFSVENSTQHELRAQLLYTQIYMAGFLITVFNSFLDNNTLKETLLQITESQDV